MPSKILVVDDDAHIREIVQFALEKAGLDVIEAGDQSLLLVQLRSFEVPPQNRMILKPSEFQEGGYGKLLEGQIDPEHPTHLRGQFFMAIFLRAVQFEIGRAHV